MADFDLVLRGGQLVDGTGAARRRADVAVAGGRIASVGEVRGRGARELDAGGLLVAPGFIDIHTHYDAQVFWDRMLSISPWHGVTTAVLGNCGFGVAPTRAEHRRLILQTLENVEGMSLDALWAGLGEDWPFTTFPEFLAAIEARGCAINVGAFIGHTPVRMFVMGEASTEREASAAEIEQMQALVQDALAAGALGFATSKSPTHVGFEGRPVPSRVAAHAELQALCDCLGRAGHGVLQATIGRGLFIDELAAIARRIGRPVTWTALLGGMLGPDGHRDVLRSAALQAEGIQVVPQVSCRPLVLEFDFARPFPFESMSLFKPVSAADRAGRKRIYADPEFRAAFRQRSLGGGLAGRWDKMHVSYSPTDRALEERNVAEAAAERDVHPVDLVLDLALASDLAARFRSAVLNDDEAIVAELLVHPAVTLGLSDAGAHASQLCDANFATHLLGHWVREKRVLELEQAVRLLTSRSADLLGIADRGRIIEGLAADLVVFDPDQVGCSPLRRVHDLPRGADRLVSDAFGIHAVVVNGVVLRERGEDRLDPAGTLPGRLVRGGQS